MYTLENDTLLVTVQPKGAELTRIFHKGIGMEFLWDAKPDVWAKHSPVLFPIVGALKENKFRYKEKEYSLPRHGFARDRQFSVTEQSPASISFLLQNDRDTEAVFPFQFRFYINYTLEHNRVSVRYQVENTDAANPLLFSVGGHPAFLLPLEPGLHYDDYMLYFNERETAGRWPITKDGLIEAAPEPLLQGTQELPLSKRLFYRDAVVLKNLQSDNVQLKSARSGHGLRFHFGGFPYLGLWASPGANFLCIEPWCGIADSVRHNGELESKEGIIRLAAGETFSRTWSVECF